MWKIALPVMDHTSTVSCVLTVETLDPLLLIYLDPVPQGGGFSLTYAAMV